MELLLNDSSLHGQFPDLSSFQNSLDHIMSCRQAAHQHGFEISCHRNLSSSRVTSTHSLQQAVMSLETDKRKVITSWLSKHGPFWEEERQHSSDDYFECNDDVVTDRAIGEAAHCRLNGLEKCLVSFNPSNYLQNPLVVNLSTSESNNNIIHIDNFWQACRLEFRLKSTAPPINSWAKLKKSSPSRFPNLSFANTAFSPLDGQPFNLNAASRLLELLKILDQLKGSFDLDGNRTPEGHKLYQTYFTGHKPWFTDSSDTEKNLQASVFTFEHPEDPSCQLVCPFHGKERTLKLRIHFTWPISANEPTYIVYVGPKLTKK